MCEVQSCFKRYEKKYLLTPAQYRAFRQGMGSFMIPDAHPKYTICNIYYVDDAAVDSAEQKKCSFLQRIQPVMVLNHGSQAR